MRLVRLLGVWLGAAMAMHGARPELWGTLVTIGDRRVHVRCEGEGQSTVVLLHGTPRFSFHFAPVMQAVARFARVCTYDRGGDAWSDAPPGGLPDAAFFVEELDGVARHVSPSAPVILAGHSIGGVLAQAYLGAHPERVSALVLVDSPSPFFTRRSAGRPPARGTFDAPATRLPEHLRAAHRWATERWYDYAERVSAAVAARYESELSALARRGAADSGSRPLPVWFVARTVGLASQRRQAARWRRAVVVSAGPVSHDIQLDQPGLVAGAIRQAVLAASSL